MALNIYKLGITDKSIFYELQTYYGIGRRTANWLCRMFGLAEQLPANQVPKHKLFKMYEFMDKNMVLEHELRVLTDINIQNLMKCKSFRGIRLEKGLPVRGQRARTNGSTQRKRPIKKQIDEK